ncbi:hypothetical protein AVEN_100411-1 [Araneus ventricosus]|uniref:Uncharacterized protein n=1 Tax=Araneus ventricosus TaxID=182803 RepID=A0A4Y2JV12_ARAVE|nr:hypothetical protein AVEN_100411-1 [Araneus ventricosus]
MWGRKASGEQREGACVVKMENCFGDADLTKNEGVTGESLVCSLVYRDQVRYPSATKLSDTIWKRTTVSTIHSGLVSVIYGNRNASYTIPGKLQAPSQEQPSSVQQGFQSGDLTTQTVQRISCLSR